MYLPKHFEETRTGVMHDLVEAHPLCTLVTLTDGLPEANHIPMLLTRRNEGLGFLTGHVARNNPLWQEHPADAEVLAIFHGPQSYISPSWYASKQEHGKAVPTWNYVAVHARGRIRFMDDADWLRTQLESLTARHENHRPEPWSLSDAPADFIQGMIRMVVGFEIEITALSGKWKVSQNRPARDIDSLATHLDQMQDTAMSALVLSCAPR